MIELKMWKNFKRSNYIDEDLEKVGSRKKKRVESRLEREIERE